MSMAGDVEGRKKVTGLNPGGQGFWKIRSSFMMLARKEGRENRSLTPNTDYWKRGKGEKE